MERRIERIQPRCTTQHQEYAEHGKHGQQRQREQESACVEAALQHLGVSTPEAVSQVDFHADCRLRSYWSTANSSTRHSAMSTTSLHPFAVAGSGNTCSKAVALSQVEV